MIQFKLCFVRKSVKTLPHFNTNYKRLLLSIKCALILFFSSSQIKNFLMLWPQTLSTLCKIPKSFYSFIQCFESFYSVFRIVNFNLNAKSRKSLNQTTRTWEKDSLKRITFKTYCQLNVGEFPLYLQNLESERLNHYISKNLFLNMFWKV